MSREASETAPSADSDLLGAIEDAPAAAEPTEIVASVSEVRKKLSPSQVDALVLVSLTRPDRQTARREGWSEDEVRGLPESRHGLHDLSMPWNVKRPSLRTLQALERKELIELSNLNQWVHPHDIDLCRASPLGHAIARAVVGDVDAKEYLVGLREQAKEDELKREQEREQGHRTKRSATRDLAKQVERKGVAIPMLAQKLSDNKPKRSEAVSLEELRALVEAAVAGQGGSV